MHYLTLFFQSYILYICIWGTYIIILWTTSPSEPQNLLGFLSPKHQRITASRGRPKKTAPILTDIPIPARPHKNLSRVFMRAGTNRRRMKAYWEQAYQCEERDQQLDGNVARKPFSTFHHWFYRRNQHLNEIFYHLFFSYRLHAETHRFYGEGRFFV